jgi:monoamine oxidase
MARTPLMRELERLISAVAGDPAREDLGAERVLTRGRFVREAGALGAAVVGAGSFSRFFPSAAAASNARIVVVGAGLAGLTCAYRLKQAGYRAQIFEGNDRVGGRCWTDRGTFADGQIAEHGGELIDTGHRELRRLARELDLELDDLLEAEARDSEPFFHFDRQAYSLAEATADIQSVWPTWSDDTDAAGYPTTYQSYTERGFELDHTPLADYLDQTIPGGLGSKLGQLLDVAYNIEYGAETDDQSTLNFLYLIGFTRQKRLQLFGESDERFHIRGGNDQVPARLAEELDGQITLGSELVAVSRTKGGGYRLTFEEGGLRRTLSADEVVLALPFSILRSSVDYSGAGFRELKQTAIEQQGMGTNSKLHLQFDTRHWESLGCNGETFADTGYQNTWEVSRAQQGNSGILVDYTGGRVGAGFGTGTPRKHARQFLEQLEPVLPGISGHWNGRVALDFWPGNPWTKGSYSYFKPGQYTTFAGVESEPEGRCHFAGEHTSLDFQGYLNGAVASGERAANEVVRSLRGS